MCEMCVYGRIAILRVCVPARLQQANRCCAAAASARASCYHHNAQGKAVIELDQLSWALWLARNWPAGAGNITARLRLQTAAQCDAANAAQHDTNLSLERSPLLLDCYVFSTAQFVLQHEWSAEWKCRDRGSTPLAKLDAAAPFETARQKPLHCKCTIICNKLLACLLKV